MPAQGKAREWEALRESYFAGKRERLIQQQVVGVKRRHQLEKEIEKLEALPENQGRTVLIKQLREQLNAITK